MKRHKTVMDAIRHYTNPLHIYCRLVRLGIRRDQARAIAAFYEHHVAYIWN